MLGLASEWVVYMAEEKTLKEVSAEVTSALGEKATLLEGFTLAFKISAAAGAFFIAVAKLQNWSDWVTYTWSAVALVSAVFVLFADKGSSKTMAQARAAIDKALE